MGNARDAAYEKGRSDQRAHERGSQRDGIGHDLRELFSPCYNPPSENREAYKAGWRDSERESHKR